MERHNSVSAILLCPMCIKIKTIHGPVDGFYFYAHGAKENRADRIMSFHEVFHVYQMTNIFSDDYEEVDAKMGRRTADDPSADVAWWSEGNADFWSALYGTDFAYFERAMRNALEGNGPFAVPRKTQYFNDGAKLYNISWSHDSTKYYRALLHH